MAVEHSTPMPQRSESGVSAGYETKFFSLWDREAWGGAHAFTYEITWIPERRCWRSCNAPFDGAILLKSARVALQS
jgi:hypothetical protein